MPKKKTKLLIVDDSAEFREAVVNQLADNPNIDARGTDFSEFEEKLLSEKSSFDVAVVDLSAEETTKQEMLRQLGEKCPVPYIVMSAENISEMEALSAGAAGVIKKPRSLQEVKAFCGILGTTAIIAAANKDKFNKAAAVKTIRRFTPEMPEKKITDAMTKRAQEGNIVVLGASTGGTDALECVIKAFPKNMPPVLVVQHMPPVFTKMYAERLNKSCAVQVKEACDGDRALPGTCIIAAGDSHL
ncbi:MAG: chemotaxis protein CheB, partial [Huintestinicola sp.]